MMALANDIDRLLHIDVFRNLSRDLLGVLALAAQTKMIRPGHEAFRAGELANGGYLILSGTLAVRFPLGFPQGNREGYLGPGSFLGEYALLTPTVWEVTLYAHTPVTLMHIPRKDFLRLITAHPETIPPIREILGKKLQNFIAACKDVLASDLA